LSGFDSWMPKDSRVRQPKADSDDSSLAKIELTA
jgi:hypothetical protein